MPLFRKEKQEGLKPLSEKDIQERLYGFFHQERGVPVGSERKAARTVDLKSVEVTPAGMTQSEMFQSNSGTQSLTQEEIEREWTDSPKEPKGNSFERQATADPVQKVRSSTLASVSNDVEKKPVRKYTRKSRKEKRGTLLSQENWERIAAGTLWILKSVAAVLGTIFSKIIIWLAESRGESRKLPTKFILVSFAILGTGIIFFNLWSSSMKPNGAGALTAAGDANQAVSQEARSSEKVSTQPAVSPVSGSGTVTQELTLSKKYFSIQVCVAQSENGAQGVVRRLSESGLPAFLDPGTSRRGGKLYRVMVGKFEDFKEAKAKLETFKKKSVMEPYQDSFIRNLSPSR